MVNFVSQNSAMKTQTVIPEVLDYPTSSVATIDLRIEKKEYDIHTEDCACVIDEVEFVKIIDLETKMPLPVVDSPQPTTAAPRKGIHKFVSRILNRMAVLPLTMPLCLVMMLGLFSENGWGQTSYLGLNGGFEGAATIDNTNTYAAPQTDKWSKANATQTLTSETTTIRSGAKSLKANNGTTGRRIWSPNISVASTTSQVTVQFYIRVASTTNSQEVQPGIINNTEGLSGSYSTGSAGNTWTKITYSKASSTFTSIAGLLMNRRIGTGGDVFIDDMAVYTGAVDNSAPSNPTLPSVSSATTSSLLVSWTAASGGVDGGGYLVVRHTADPTTAPNTNGIYAVNNTIVSGTVVYQGTNVSFTDNSLASGTTYYYRIYTYDKAYNYSAAATVNGTTTAAATAPAAPTISSITPGNQQLSVAFTAGSDGGSAITNYKYSTNGGTNWQTRASGTTASPLVISTLSTDGTTALTNGTSYNVQIRAVNAVGDGTATASTAATPRTTPSTPTITGITPGNQQLSVAFTAGSDGGSAITTYKYSTDGGINWQTRASGTTASPLLISTLSTDGTTALTNGVSYDIQIRAVNAAGDGTATGTTQGTPTAPASPTLNAVTLASVLSTTYGTASAGVSFAVGGSNLTTTITVTPQSGYEIATSSGGTYQSTAMTGIANGSTLWVRFASTYSAGTYNSATAVVLSGGGASSSANVTTSSSSNSVSQKALTITGLTAQNKVYDGLTTATTTGTAALTGVVSPDAVTLSGTPSFTFASAAVGTGISVSTTGYSLTGAQSGNYTLTQPSFTANITVRSLTITADDVSKYAGVALTGGAGSTAFTSSGLQNGETIGSVTIAYGSAGLATGDGNTVGVYASQVTPSAATSGTFTASNYSITYVAGSITVLEAPVAILQWKTFGNTGTETTEPSFYNDPNIASTNLTQGSITAAANTNRFGGSNWWNTGDATNSTIANAITGNDYIQFIVTPNSGSVFTPTSFVFNWDKSSSGPQNVALRSSVDNFASDLGTIAPTAAIGTSNTITISGLNNIATATTFRVYGYGGTATGGTGGFDVGSDVVNVQLNGYVKSVPQLSTPTATSIGTTSATLGATITSNGGASITARGTVYGSSASPSTNSEAEGGTSVAAFTHSRTGLTTNTLYYYRGYATNSVGTGYSADGTFTTLHNAPTVGSGSNATATTIDASWIAPSGGSEAFTYEIQVDNDSDFSSPTFTQSNISSGTTTHTATGLASNTTYYFRVRANNAAGSSAWSSTSSGYATTVAASPTLSGTSLTAFGNVCINTTTSPNSFTINGAALTSADVTVSSLSGFTFSTTAGGTYTSTLTLSQAGGTYAQDIYVKFNPTAVQSYGGNIVIGGGGATSVNVAASGSGIAGSVSVTTTAASSITSTGASTGGSSVSTTCGTITAKGVAYGTSANPTTPVTSDGTGTGNFTSTLSGLTPNTLYNYRAYATNSNSVTSYGSNLTFTTLHNAPTVGSGSSATTSAITANWTSPVGGGSETFTYEVEISTSSSFASSLSTQSGISSGTTSYQFTGLSDGTSYYFRVRVVNAGGNSDWSAISSGYATIANAVILSALGTVASENFNSLANSGISSTTPTGWYFSETGTGANSTYTAGTGSGTTGETYSFGLASNSDRAFGGLQSSSVVPRIGAKIQNNTGSTINNLNITYSGETWRVGATGRTDQLDFEYSIDATSLTNGTWIPFNSLDYVNIIQGSTSSGLMIHTASISDVITGLTIANGTSFWIRWIDFNTSGADDGMGVDDFSIKPCGTVSAPSASPQSFCSASSPTVASLSATGSNIQWYDASTNGNLLASNTSLATGTYYASQTVSGCESATRASVSVTINSSGTWIGDSNDDWNIAGNWCGGVPNSSSASVSIPSGITVNLDASPSLLNLTIGSGSVVNAGDNTLSIANGGTFTNNGSFNSETSEVIFLGTATLGGSNEITFNNLTLNGNVTINAIPTVSGILQLNNGANVLNKAINYGPSGQLIYNQSGTINATSFEWPTSNKPSQVAVYNNTEVLLNENKTITGSLNLANGKVNLGNYNLTLETSASIVTGGFSNARMVIAEGNGELRKRFTEGSSNPAEFIFPVGTKTGAVEYTPVHLDFSSALFGSNAYVGVKVRNTKNVALNSGVTNYLDRNWIVEPSDITNYTYKIQLYYNQNDFVTDGSLAEGNLIPIKISSGQWYQPTDGTFNDASSQGTGTVFPSNDYLEWNNLTTFSEFGGAGGSNQPLPVELLSFNASCLENQTVLTWQTASEHNASHFDIEKSTDGTNWRVIGQVQAAGNSTELLSYNFVDNDKSNAYYRLNQLDIDGKNEYFGPISSSCESGKFKFLTSPNPSNSQFNLQIYSNVNESVNIEIQDLNGKVVQVKQLNVQNGINIYLIHSDCPQGVYYIRLVRENNEIFIIKQLIF
jgi:predicted RNA-binding protein with TRAM domain